MLYSSKEGGIGKPLPVKVFLTSDIDDVVVVITIASTFPAGLDELVTAFDLHDSCADGDMVRSCKVAPCVDLELCAILSQIDISRTNLLRNSAGWRITNMTSFPGYHWKPSIKQSQAKLRMMIL